MNMYVNPFLCGVVNTILVEVVLIVGCAIIGRKNSLCDISTY